MIEESTSPSLFTIFDNFPGLVLVKNGNLEIVYLNDLYQSLSGITKKNITGKKESDLYFLYDHEVEDHEFDILINNNNFHVFAHIPYLATKDLWNIKKYVNYINSEKYLIILAEQITEKRSINEQLKKNENYLKAIADYSDAVMAVLDKDCRIKTFFGSEKIMDEEDIGLKILISDIIKSNEREKIQENVTRVLQSGEVFTEQKSTVYKEHSYVFKDSYYPIERYDKRVTEVGIIRRDISKSSEIQGAYETIVNYSVFGLLIVQDDICIFNNSKLVTLFEYDTATVKGISIHEIVTNHVVPAFHHVFIDFYSQITEKKIKSALCIVPVYSFYGNEIWVEAIGNSIVYKGKPAVQIAVLDVSERKKAQQNLEMYKHIMNTSHEQIIYIGNDLKINLVNHTALKSFGVTFNDVINKPLSYLIGDNVYYNSIKQYVLKCLKENQSYQTEQWISHEDKDSFFDILVYPYFEFDEFENITYVAGVVLLMRDITDEITTDLKMIDIAENERRNLAMELHDNLTHQLLGISIQAKLLCKEFEKNGSKYYEQLSSVHDDLNRSIQFVRNLSKGVSPIEEEKKDFKSMVLELQQIVTKRYQIKCDIEIDNDIELRDVRILENLYYIIDEAIVNSIKHACVNEVKIVAYFNEGYLNISIVDKGKGFDCEKLYNGMGLKFIKARCRAISASLDVQSAVETGTVVSCKLKL